jgi:hypothetical protein
MIGIIPLPILNAEELKTAWLEGITHFNERRPWHAHESWERGWKSLPADEKLYVQAMIQACGAFHLFSIRRDRPAVALCRSALNKLAALDGRRTLPRIEIPGLEASLTRITQAPFELSRAKAKVEYQGLVSKLLLLAEA